jgi:hypothetical protein
MPRAANSARTAQRMVDVAQQQVAVKPLSRHLTSWSKIHWQYPVQKFQ